MSENTYQPGEFGFPAHVPGAPPLTPPPMTLQATHPHIPWTCATDLDAQTRWCSRCSETKPLTAFSRNQTAPAGRQYWCKDCRNAYNRQFHPHTDGGTA